MKFVHIADMHFDAPFSSLNRIESLGEKRRLEQRQVLKEVIEYIKQEKIEYLFIAGDFYEHEYIKQSTIEYIHKLFEEIPDTKIYIAPGNHDPFLKNSLYNTTQWGKNVFIFKGAIEKKEEDGVNIYGYGFRDFYDFNCDIENIQLEDKSKINIFLTHGTIEGGVKDEREYNLIKTNVLKQIGFDYIALGHIHKSNYTEKTNIVYPGSMISLGFDELRTTRNDSGRNNSVRFKTTIYSLR